MKKYLVPEILFDLMACQDVLSVSYDKVTDSAIKDDILDKENFGEDIF